MKTGPFCSLTGTGLINHRIVDGYVRSWEQFQFNHGVKEALKELAGLFGAAS